jgi:hypothetical protein
MKTKYMFMLPALILIILAGCNKPEGDVDQEEVQPSQELVEDTFAFSSQFGVATKVALNADNSLFWTAGDKIAVYDYKKSTTTKVQQDGSAISGGEGTTAAKFTPETHSASSDWYDGGDADSQAYSFFAWYPLNGSIPTPDESQVVAIGNVSATQTQAAGIGSYIICWAESETTKTVLESGTAPTFSFAPKTALLKLTIKNSADLPTKITSLRISAASGNIAGNASLNLATGVLSGGASNSITYTPSDPIEIAAGATATVPVTISVLPGTPGTLTVEAEEEGYDYTPVDITLATIESGKVYPQTVTFTRIERKITITNSSSKTDPNLAKSSTLESELTVTEGVMSGDVYFYGTANCLVMNASTTTAPLSIALYKTTVTDNANGFARTTTSASPKISDARYARVIWAESDLYHDKDFYIVSGTTSQLIIKKSAGTTGNALVGIYDSEDDLLWSYHIWCPVDDSVVEVDNTAKSAQYTAYKLALGQINSATADTYMYYQWGRKDPMGRAVNNFGFQDLIPLYGVAGEYPAESLNIYSGTGTGKTDQPNNNLTYARQNPWMFIKNVDTGTTYDWFPTVANTAYQSNALWRPVSDGIKAISIYDPCPQGYHVPADRNLWWIDQSSGSTSTGYSVLGLNYVLGGYRNRGDAQVYNVSSYGYYWSAEANGVYESYLDFNSTGSVNPSNYYSRAYGFGVRCVKN